MIKMIFYALASVVVAGVAGFFALGLSSQGGSAPGLVDNRLAQCPTSPNCVSSETGTDSDKAVEPLPITAWDAIPATIADMGGKVTVREDGYIAAEFKSAVFGFVDDVEFRKAENSVHVRSASRVGHSDAGVNAARVSELRKALTEQAGTK